MEKANVPIVRGTKDIKDAQHAIKSVKELGLPVIIKAAGGGGGKGLRIVRDIDEVESSFNAVISEAKVTDPDPRVFIEQFIENAKHIEVQVIADKFGNAVHLGTRDCSMQRNNQKIIEEAPALISKDLEEEMCAASLRAVKEIGYINAGTFEYLVCENKFYFLEMNTRLQVEHTVTEQVFGIDIVKEQINIELDHELSFTQADVEVRGHAIECRINAEDPFHNFTPCPGKITHMHLPGGYNVRNDFGVYANGVVPIFYDSLVGKIIVTGHTRIDAINNMKRALDEFEIEGIKTTVSFQEILLDEKEYVENTYATTFIEQNYDRILSEVNDVQFN
jgi:acetyl/propionyl-CoA carboxylase alpha subunit